MLIVCRILLSTRTAWCKYGLAPGTLATGCPQLARRPKSQRQKKTGAVENENSAEDMNERPPPPEVEKHVLAVLRHLALDDGVVARAHNNEGHKDLWHRTGGVASMAEERVVSEGGVRTSFFATLYVVDASEAILLENALAPGPGRVSNPSARKYTINWLCCAPKQSRT